VPRVATSDNASKLALTQAATTLFIVFKVVINKGASRHY